MCVREPGSQDWTAPAGVTFRDWLRDGGSGTLRAPTAEDLDYHLSTLFPPVRPRGHMELRMIDAQPGDGWIVPAAVVTALADDRPRGRRRAGRRRAGVGRTAGRRGPLAEGGAARPGRPADQPGQQAVLRGRRAALGRLGVPAAIRRAVADFTERYVQKDRCPADDQLDGV